MKFGIDHYHDWFPTNHAGKHGTPLVSVEGGLHNGHAHVLKYSGELLKGARSSVNVWRANARKFRTANLIALVGG